MPKRLDNLMTNIQYQRHNISLPKVAVVTGGGTGLGQAITKQLAQKGLKIFIIGRRAHKLKETQAFSPHKIIPLVADISLAQERIQIAEKLKNINIDYLVHNAAIVFPITPLEKITLEAFRQMLSTNVEAPLFLTQILLRQLNPEARILHISSDCASYPLASWIPYCTSKAALSMIVQCLKKELSSKNIYSGSIDPGMMDTPMQRAILSKEVQFPEKMSLEELEHRRLLFSPEHSAKICMNLLLETSPEVFQQEGHCVT